MTHKTYKHFRLARLLLLAGVAVGSPAWAEAPQAVPVVDGSGALGDATGPGGSMNGSLYVPERQATRPDLPRRRQGDGYRHRPYRHDQAGRYKHWHERRNSGVDVYRRRGNYRLDSNGQPYPSSLPDQAPRNNGLNGATPSPNRQQLEDRFGD